MAESTSEVAPFTVADGQATGPNSVGDASHAVPVIVQGVVTPAVVDYRLQVGPMLSKAGCNMGACRASQHGKCGSVLSVVGYDPNSDHASIVRDRLAANKFRELGIQPSPRCDDATFLQRVFLDCIGSTPSVEETQAFLDSDAPDRRTRLVDRLLGFTGDPTQGIYNDRYAAFFSRVGLKNSEEFRLFGREQVVLVKATCDIRHPRTGQLMEPRNVGRGRGRSPAGPSHAVGRLAVRGRQPVLCSVGRRSRSRATVSGTAVVQVEGHDQMISAVATPYQETYQPGGGRGHWPVAVHTVSVGAPSDILAVTLSEESITLKPGESKRIDVQIERAEGFDKNVTLDVQSRHLSGDRA